jgi:lipid-A-disaccharide synthase
MRIFFSVGEPSGDQHAARLVEELRRRRPGLECVGFGGPHMEQAGFRVHYRLTDLAVMGFLRVLPLLWRFFTLARQARRYFREQRPDAVVLVDFPGFNWWIARYAKQAGIPVFWFLPPQIWAWASWRVEKMRRFVDHVLTALPFEPDWYAARGIRVEHVGHPFFDEAAEKRLDAAFLEHQRSRPGRIVGLLPGSRNHEVRRNFAVMLETARRIRARHPDVRFLVACYKPAHREHCAELVDRLAADLPVELCVGRTSEIVETAACCLMVSGSVSLELLARRCPAVVLYRGSWLTWAMGHLLIKIPFISLPNLMAGRLVFPEFPSAFDPEDDIRGMVGHFDAWLSDPAVLPARRKELDELCRRCETRGAVDRAAAAVLARLAPDSAAPHDAAPARTAAPARAA